MPAHRGELFLALKTWIKSRGLGAVYHAPCAVILDANTIVEPDLSYVSKARASIVTKRAIEAAPDLVIEILSPSTERRDRGTKMKLYARFGIDHYWIVDPAERTLEVYERRGDAYVVAATHAGDSVMRCTVLPGLEINLAEVWPT